MERRESAERSEVLSLQEFPLLSFDQQNENGFWHYSNLPNSLPSQDAIVTSIFCQAGGGFSELLCQFLTWTSSNLLGMKKTFSFVDIVSEIWTLRNANVIYIANPIHLHKLQICWISHCDPLYVDIWVWSTFCVACKSSLSLSLHIYS